MVPPATHKSKAPPARHPPPSRRTPAPKRARASVALNVDEHLLIDGAHKRDYAGGAISRYQAPSPRMTGSTPCSAGSTDHEPPAPVERRSVGGFPPRRAPQGTTLRRLSRGAVPPQCATRPLARAESPARAKLCGLGIPLALGFDDPLSGALAVSRAALRRRLARAALGIGRTRDQLWRPVAATAAQPASGNLEQPRLAPQGVSGAAAARKCRRWAVQNG